MAHNFSELTEQVNQELQQSQSEAMRESVQSQADLSAPARHIPEKKTFSTRLKKLATRWNSGRREHDRQQKRAEVEQAYAREHPREITIVPKLEQTPKELKMTRQGRYEMNSNGQLTDAGKSLRLCDRYTRTSLILGVLIIWTYLILFFL